MPPNCGNNSLQIILNQIFARLEGVAQGGGEVDLSEVLAALTTVMSNLNSMEQLMSNQNLDRTMQIDSAELTLITAIEAIDCSGGGGGTVDLSAVMAALTDIQANTPTDLSAVMTLLNEINAKPSGQATDLTAVMAALTDIQANTPTDLSAVMTALAALQSTANTINTNTSGLSAQITPIGTNVINLQTTANTINSNTSGLSAQITPIGTNVISLQSTANTINSNTSGLTAQITPIGTNVTSLQSTANTINSNTSGLTAQITAVQNAVNLLGGGIVKAVTIWDEKPQSTHGGTFTNGGWRQRDLNTKNDPYSLVSLSANAVTILKTGNYLVRVSAPASHVGNHRCRLTLNGLLLATGTTELTQIYTNAINTSRSFCQYVGSLQETNVLRVEHVCVSNSFSPSSGFGQASGLAAEVYTQMEIIKLD